MLWLTSWASGSAANADTATSVLSDALDSPPCVVLRLKLAPRDVSFDNVLSFRAAYEVATQYQGINLSLHAPVGGVNVHGTHTFPEL